MKNTLKVSKKFYSGIASRVAGTCAIVSPDGKMARSVMALIDRFLTDGNVDIESELQSAPVEVRLIFSLLRPEIERAMQRSLAARARAARRREALQPSLALQPEEPVESLKSLKTLPSPVCPLEKPIPAPEAVVAQPSETGTSQIFMSRRERRRLLHERRRAARKGLL